MWSSIGTGALSSSASAVSWAAKGRLKEALAAQVSCATEVRQHLRTQNWPPWLQLLLLLLLLCACWLLAILLSCTFLWVLLLLWWLLLQLLLRFSSGAACPCPFLCTRGHVAWQRAAQDWPYHETLPAPPRLDHHHSSHALPQAGVRHCKGCCCLHTRVASQGCLHLHALFAPVKDSALLPGPCSELLMVRNILPLCKTQ